MPKMTKKAMAKGKGTVSLTEEVASPKKKVVGVLLFGQAFPKPTPSSLTLSCPLLQNCSSCANSTEEPSNVLMVSPWGRKGTVGCTKLAVGVESLTATPLRTSAPPASPSTYCTCPRVATPAAPVRVMFRRVDFLALSWAE